MGTLVLKRTIKSKDTSKKNPHIVIVGQKDWQNIVFKFLEAFLTYKQPMIKMPNSAEVEYCLGQFEPNLVIVTNYSLEDGLTLEKILSKVPATSVVVMCDKFTIDKVRPMGVHYTETKNHVGKNLIPIVKQILMSQGY